MKPLPSSPPRGFEDTGAVMARVWPRDPKLLSVGSTWPWAPTLLLSLLVSPYPQIHQPDTVLRPGSLKSNNKKRLIKSSEPLFLFR